MIKKYRKKPIEIEAMLYLGVQSLQEAIDFCGLHQDFNKWFCDKEEYFKHVANDREVFKIITLEGTMECSPGDYIIKGIKGEFYPCKPDIFRSTYDEVSS